VTLNLADTSVAKSRPSVLYMGLIKKIVFHSIFVTELILCLYDVCAGGC